MVRQHDAPCRLSIHSTCRQHACHRVECHYNMRYNVRDITSRRVGAYDKYMDCVTMAY